MIELIYGFLVIVAASFALYSRCELIQKTMLTLFIGWLVYVNAQTFASFQDRVQFNLVVDIIQVSICSLTYASWKNHKLKNICHWVCGAFAAMLFLHITQLLWSMNLRAYYILCNILFTVQMLAVILYSRLSYIDLIAKQGTSKWQTKTNESPDLKVVAMRTRKS